MRKILLYIFIPIAVIGIIVGIIYFKVKNTVNHPFISKDDTIKVTVKSGDTINSVLDNLSNSKTIGNEYIIKWYIKKEKLSTTIKPGTYFFTKDMTLERFVKALNNGTFDENAIRITIPEGYDIEHMAALFEQKGLISKDDFLKSVKEYKLPGFIKANDKRKYALEGYLFPDTYDFKKGAKGNEIIDMMLKNFDIVIADIEKNDNRIIDRDKLDGYITMASIVEREAEAGSDRAIIASVFYNRIKIKMKLQSCATVEYALGVHKTIYSDEDIKTPSPFNTYIVEGLPAGPICSPGREAIKAALDPAQTNYLYFVAKFDGTKTHFFTDNYQKFLQDKKVSEINRVKNGY